jgi:hypothetical protein
MSKKQFENEKRKKRNCQENFFWINFLFRPGLKLKNIRVV